MSKIKLLIMDGVRTISGYDIRPTKEVRYLLSKGHEVEAILFHNKYHGHEVKHNTIEGAGAVHYIGRSEKVSRWMQNPVFRKILFPYYFFMAIKFMLWLRRYLKDNPCDFLLCHNLFSAIIGRFSKPRKTKTVFIMRELYEGQTTSKANAAIRKAASQWMQNKADAIVYVVPAQYERMSERNREKATFIPNYADKKTYEGSQKTKSDKIRVNYIGGVRDFTSLKTLMDAAKHVEGITVGIHGDGSAYNQLLAIADDYPNVSITGHYDREKETKELFENTDIVYCAYNPSYGNCVVALPTKFLEAMLTGTAVLLSRGMLAAEKIAIKENAGFLVEYGNVEALAKVLHSIVENPLLLHTKMKNAQRISGNYVWESVVEQMDRVLEQAESQV